MSSPHEHLVERIVWPPDLFGGDWWKAAVLCKVVLKTCCWHSETVHIPAIGSPGLSIEVGLPLWDVRLQLEHPQLTEAERQQVHDGVPVEWMLSHKVAERESGG